MDQRAIKLGDVRTEGASTTRPVTVITQQATEIDRSTTRTLDLRTTLRVPVGKLTLAGGMSLDSMSFMKSEPAAHKNAAATPVDPPQVYLFISVTPESTPKK